LDLQFNDRKRQITAARRKKSKGKKKQGYHGNAQKKHLLQCVESRNEGGGGFGRGKKVADSETRLRTGPRFHETGDAVQSKKNKKALRIKKHNSEVRGGGEPTELKNMRAREDHGFPKPNSHVGKEEQKKGKKKPS